jgi:Magnesium chelatase, subunit ChlI C-terminal
MGPGYAAGGDIVLCMTQLNLSARAYHRMHSVKLARTIADLAGMRKSNLNIGQRRYTLTCTATRPSGRQYQGMSQSLKGNDGIIPIWSP